MCFLPNNIYTVFYFFKIITAVKILDVKPVKEGKIRDAKETELVIITTTTCRN